MTAITVYASVQSAMLPPDTTDAMLIEMWLHGRGAGTQQGYRKDLRYFREFTHECPLQRLTLADIQQYQDMLIARELSEATIARRLNSLKSLLSFAYQTGYNQFDVGKMVEVQQQKKNLAERILSEEQVLSIILKEQDPRNHAILRTLYSAGLRVSELSKLQWKDVQPRAEDMGQLTIFGKGRKTRVVLVSSTTYAYILAQGPSGTTRESYVFPSTGGGRHKGVGGPLHPSQLGRIVERAAIQAGVETYSSQEMRGGIIQDVTHSRVSPHWLRHAHASHALERGASIALVQATLGHESITTTSGYTHARPGESSSRYLQI